MEEVMPVIQVAQPLSRCVLPTFRVPSSAVHVWRMSVVLPLSISMLLALLPLCWPIAYMVVTILPVLSAHRHHCLQLLRRPLRTRLTIVGMPLSVSIPTRPLPLKEKPVVRRRSVQSISVSSLVAVMVTTTIRLMTALIRVWSNLK